ncbi:MAG: DeoR/GlpR family DNA-binding transcription regulator [Opitutaceae bacterium]|jgi:DeoR/GlpR family transcriptional regulator of sugar metabolism|nr:DeoR/GlpR family DNA-binding transcription regulator [Opitutaceae bacterium]
MLPAQRHQAILDLLETEGTVRTLPLAKRFRVTDETIRHDLDALAAAGHLLRIHGGATRGNDTRHDLPLPERAALHPREKALVAREAVKLIQPRDTVFFDASSTVLTMTRFLGPQPVTVLTNAHHVVVALGGRPNCDLICTGGNYEERSRSYVGPGAEEALRRFVIRWMFVGLDGLHPELGASELNPGQAVLKERLIPRAEKLCVVTDHSKLGRTTPFLFAQPEQIDVLVTDAAAPKDILAQFESRGVKIILAHEEVLVRPIPASCGAAKGSVGRRQA